jgi:glutathione reductase (NADPH)
MYDYDLFVIGAGSGGVAAARRAGSYGARVGICEEWTVGGTCVNRGCIPKKLYVYASHFRDEVEDAGGYGWSVTAPSFDWPRLVAAKRRELARLNGIYDRLLADSGVRYLVGRGRLEDPHTVRVGSERVTAEHVVIATGARPWLPDIPGSEHAISSDDAFDLPELPRRVVIVGGGYIAVEFAGIFNGLGVETTVCYRGDLLLRGFDQDVRRALCEELPRKGIDLRLNTNLTAIESRGGLAAGGFAATTTGGDVLEADTVLFATGRLPNSGGLGLEAAGVELNAKGAVVVDAWSRTKVPSVWAIGDVTDRINLTPVAIREGRALAETLFNDNPMQPDHSDVPSAVFSQPPVGSVGLTEEQARTAYGTIDVYRTRFRPLRLTLTERTEQVMMKLIVDRASDRVIGCHMVGADAAEIVQGLGIALKCGATKAQFDATVGIHPTSAEEWTTFRDPLPESA